MTQRVWEIAYGEGWDPEIQLLVGPLPEAEARRRDAAGEQYSLVAYVDGQPVRVIDIDWSHDYCAVWRLDSKRHRDHRLDYRRLDPHTLTLVGIDHWRYQAGQAEGEPPTYHERETFDPEQGMVWIRHSGGVWGRHPGRGESWSRPVPIFGDWAPLLDSKEATVATPITVREPDPRGVVPGLAPPWLAPRPLQPEGLDTILTPGRRYRLLDGYRHEYHMITRIEEGPVLRLPTGSLIVAEPQTGVRTPYTTAVEPGDYRMEFVVAAADGYDRIAAVRLVIRAEATESWELAVQPGQDVRTLSEGHFYGFGVDGGVGAFYDEATAELADYDRDRGNVFSDALRQPWLDYTEPGAPGNVVAFMSARGDGAYPVWIGRTAAGEVACFLADMLLLSDATDVTPGPAPEPLPETGHRQSEPP